MKFTKFFYIFAIVFVVLLGFAACKNSDEVNNPKPVSEPTMEQMYDDISQVLSSTTFNEEEMQQFDKMFGDIEMTDENLEEILNTPEYANYITTTECYKRIAKLLDKYFTEEDIVLNDDETLTRVKNTWKRLDYTPRIEIREMEKRVNLKSDKFVLSLYSAMRNYAFATKVGSVVFIRDSMGNEQMVRMLFDDVKVQGDKMPLYEITVADIGNLDEAEIIRLAKSSEYSPMDIDHYSKLRERMYTEGAEKNMLKVETKADCDRQYQYAMEDAYDNFRFCCGSFLVGGVIAGFFGGPTGPLVARLTLDGGLAYCTLKYKADVDKAASRRDDCYERVSGEAKQGMYQYRIVSDLKYVDIIR